MAIQVGELDLYGILQVDPRAHPSVVQAAYRALARLLHPDQTRTDATEPKMALVNHAYDVLRDPSRRDAYDRGRRRPAAVGPGAVSAPQPEVPRTSVSAPAGGGSGTAINFGRYAGWTLEQLARQDPDYLVWLQRHSSGVGYRRRIDEILAAARTARPSPARARRS
ncbi:MAG: DnaJ domain-containing protein [Candidatus Limnocylindria bacterium]